MPKCHNHPEVDARVVCQKVNIRGYCEECMEKGEPCFDPGIYCKFRSQCVIWELAREAGHHRRGENKAAAGS